MVKKMVIPTPKPTPAPARITVGQKILARMDEMLEHAAVQEKRLKDLESQFTILSQAIIEVIEQLDEIRPRLGCLENVAESTRKSAEAAEISALDARMGVDNLSERMPDVEEVVQHIRSQERIEWLASMKPAF
jgi:predicted  nucleic acid-binding Zn-ribbon protein